LAFSLAREEHLEMICMSLETFGGRCDAAKSARLCFGRPAYNPLDGVGSEGLPMPHLWIPLIRSEVDSRDGGSAVLPLAVQPRQSLDILAKHHPPYRVEAHTFLAPGLAEQIRDI
jgi:hypothetical protein